MHASAAKKVMHVASSEAAAFSVLLKPFTWGLTVLGAALVVRCNESIMIKSQT